MGSIELVQEHCVIRAPHVDRLGAHAVCINALRRTRRGNVAHVKIVAFAGRADTAAHQIVLTNTCGMASTNERLRLHQRGLGVVHGEKVRGVQLLRFAYVVSNIGRVTQVRER